MKLLFLATRDGFGVDDINSRIAGKGPLLFLVKVRVYSMLRLWM